MNFRYFVADDIQNLAEGKTLAVGLYGDNVIVGHIPKEILQNIENGPIAFTSLTILFAITDAKIGAGVAMPRLIGPDGQEVNLNFVPVQFLGEVGKSVNLIFKLQPFVVNKAGSYQFIINILGEDLVCPFEVKLLEALS